MPDEKLPGKLLTQLFDRAVTFEMIESVEYLLEELAHFQGKPPIAAYREALKVYAKTGDVSKVHRTFDRLVADHGNPKSRRLLSPILSVHARLGDVSETKRQFDRISAEFGLQPNTVCWNILIQAYVTAGDLPGAASTFAKMMKKGETPSSHTFGTIMALFAKRGDIQNVSRLIDEARKMKVEVTRPMMDTVVRVYLKNDKHDHAEKLVCATWKTATGGSPVQLWNTLLWHHAFKVQKRYFSRILGEIGKHGLKPDAGTYSAIIFAHAITQQPDEARSVLRKMAKAGIEPTEQHYSIVMFAYMKRRNRDMVHVILHEMQTRFGRVGMSASLVNLKMQIERDLENAKRADTPAENLSFPHAEKALMTSINQFNGDPSPTKMPSIDASGSARQHFPAVHYQHLIQAYGNEAAIDKAREALGQYLQSVQSTSSSDEKMVKLPFGFIKALMSAHLKAHEFDKVEEYWKILWPGITTFASRFDLDQILPVAPTVTETGRTGRTKSEVLSSQQFILDAPLHMYMRSLASENNYRKLHRVVSKVQEAGFVLTASNWSTYIELLTVSDDRSEQIQAFKLFEKMFQPKFPGWFYMKRGFGLRPAGSAATLLDLEGRVGLTAPRRVMGKIARRHWLRIHPDYMHPSYRTIVYLARRLKSIRASSIEDGSGTLSELFETTPGTIQILADMPQLPDKYQNQLLRDGEKEPEVLRKPKALRSTSSGLLGEGERLKRRSISKAEIQPRSRRDIEPSNTAREQFNVLTKVLPPSDRVTMEMQFHKYLKPMSVGRKRPTRRIIVLDRPKRNTIIRAKPKQHPESLSPKEETPKKQASSKHTASTKSTVSTKGMSFKARAQLASTSNPIWTLYNPKTGYHEPRKVHTKRRDRRSGIIRRDYLRKATSKARPGPSSPETKAGYSDSLFEWRRALR
jgi:pentatricopeptide repeat-containing protein PET309